MKFRKPCNGNGSMEQSDFFAASGSWGTKLFSSRRTKVCTLADNVKKLSLSEFPVCSVCQKLGVYGHLPIKAQPYFLLPNKHAGGKKSDRRRVWHFVVRERRPRKRHDPKGRSVWDVTYNHEAAGSDVWLQAWVFVFVRTTVATLHQTGHQKNVRSPLRLFGSREYDISSEGEGRL